MRFGVLGPLAVWTSDGVPVAVPGLKVRALLADLLVHEGRPVPADRLVDDLWGDHPPGNPSGALSAKVSQLRRVLEDAEPGGRELLVHQPAGYLLRADTDADRFSSLIARASRAGDPRATAALLSEALAAWRGPAFADFADEPFTRAAVARLEQQRLTAHEDRAEALLALGEHVPLAGELGDLLAEHPLRERLRATHMRALYRAGRQSEALESYEELRTLLADELGLDPSAGLVALHRAILTHDPSLAAPDAPDLSAARPATNLPAPLTGLIGRDDAVAEIGARLETERLVTLTGPGGVGKTRLAVETARRLTGPFPDGVWLVELAALDRPADHDAMSRLAEAVMAVLDIRDATGPAEPAGPMSAVHRLTEALRPRRLLLVLDNCEHVVEPVAELAEALLRTAPGLRILATSQEPLALAGEVVWSVPPLEVPDRAADLTDLTVLERTGSVRLFVTRASAAARGFALDADTAPAVAVLCRRLDGIPLALELAATRVRALGVHGLVDRLDDRFRLLATGHRGAPPRQRTLMAMIDWSWELLSDSERVVLRRLAVHVDGCTLPAAEVVCAEDGLDVVDLLTRLVDRSLVVMVDGGGAPRYRLLESVAAYCAGQLQQAGELEEVRRRHRGYYIGLAEQAEPHLYGSGQRGWLRRLDAEAANLRAALNAAVRDEDADGALRLVNAMAWYWFLRGRLTEARRSLATALSVPDATPDGAEAAAPTVPGEVSFSAGAAAAAIPGEVSFSAEAPAAAVPGEVFVGAQVTGGAEGVRPSALRGKALAWDVGIGLLHGHVAGRDERRRAALRMFEGTDDPGGRARAEWFLAYAGIGIGDLAVAEHLVSRALPTFQELGDRWGTAAVLATRGKLAHVRGDLAALGRDSERSAELFGELGDRWGQLEATGWLGALAEMTGDLERAHRLHLDGQHMAEELGLWTEVAGRLSWLGWIALQRGDYTGARELCERALRLTVEQGHQDGQIFAMMGLSFAARRDGDLDLAETHLRDVLGRTSGKHAEEAPPPHLPSILTELGFVAEQRGDAAEALALHLESLGHVAKFGTDWGMPIALDGLAGALSLAGDHDRAARLLGAAASARASSSVSAAPAERGDIERVTARVRLALGDDRFAAEFDRGGALTPTEVKALTHAAATRAAGVS
ncbi:winged helix-turn-helix domain-containing protein [Sphaerisporangium sp. NBC_01403]|uniref:BTAD domain-containing putative transcriptional regulator n=1 Tax=Sphaerisporangium sp. NBC_01403 TaxID=2903599 RepID=UPI00325020BD